MASSATAKMGSLPAMKRQHLLAELYVLLIIPSNLLLQTWNSRLHGVLTCISSAGLKQACPHGIYVSLTPGDPTLWSGVIFVRKGPASLPFSSFAE
jgi:hypothetical protein